MWDKETFVKLCAMFVFGFIAAAVGWGVYKNLDRAEHAESVVLELVEAEEVADQPEVPGFTFIKAYGRTTKGSRSKLVYDNITKTVYIESSGTYTNLKVVQ